MTGTRLTAAQTRRIQKAVDSVPYAHLLGIELDDIGKGAATLGLDVRDELTQNHGVVHGGAIRHGDGFLHHHSPGASGEGDNGGLDR
jgi:hypothetical protein